MQRIKTFEVLAAASALERAFEAGGLPKELNAPLGAMVGELAARVYESPTAVYLCSSDDDATPRNYFGYALAKAMLEHAPRTLLVDCDFLHVGLSGIVPQRDGLGFLDLLLYGSSLGVIMQETKGGVCTIGAGSFPLPKKSPFVMDAFENTSRYLVNQTGCVIFCGPALDDGGEPHPIVGQVDLPILFRSGVRIPGGALDPVEDKVLTVKPDTQVWSVWLVEPAAPVRPRDLEETQPAPSEPLQEAPDVVVEVTRESRKPAPDTVEEASPSTVAALNEADELTLGHKSGNSLFPKIITSVLAVFLVAFVLYWLYLTRSIREKVAEPSVSQTRQTTPAEIPPQPPADADEQTTSQPSDTIAVAAGGTQKPAPEEPKITTPDTSVTPTQTATRKPATSPPAQSGIVVTERIADFAGDYVIHISSFRTLESAKKDATYLADRGQPVIIAHVDLGVKGFWYRVYVGPLATRDEARSVKIKLDEFPRVKFTRITKVTG